MLGKKSYTVIDQNVPTAQQGGNSLIWSMVESSSQFSSTHKVSQHGGGGGGGAGMVGRMDSSPHIVSWRWMVFTVSLLNSYDSKSFP